MVTKTDNLQINSLPNKFLDLTKFKAIADNKFKVTEMIISVFDRAENIVGKGETSILLFTKQQYFIPVQI